MNTHPNGESEKLEEIVFALSHRNSATIALIECGSLAKRDEIEKTLEKLLSEYEFYSIDVTSLSVNSLKDALDRNLPSKIINSKPVSYIVNIYGLENSLVVNEEGKINPSAMTAQLNLERETLFRVPYIIILWGSEYFFRTLQYEAPDFWNWVTYKFAFSDDNARSVDDLSIPSPEPYIDNGNTEARRLRIKELEELLANLSFNSRNQIKFFKDKISILFSLANEYAGAFEYKKAESAFLQVIALQRNFRASKEDRGEAIFNLGKLYESSADYSKAIIKYEECIKFSTDTSMPVVYFHMGKTYAKMRRWNNSLNSYNNSLRAYNRIGAVLEIGSVYHQMGVLYQAQKNWNMSLEYFNKALPLETMAYSVTNNPYYGRGIGYTYHNMGMVYAQMGQFNNAEDSYNKSIEWKINTGNTFEIGSSYHQLGLLADLMNKPDIAIKNFHSALEWNMRVGNMPILGGTYLMLARHYSDNNEPDIALSWITKSIINLSKYRSANMVLARQVMRVILQQLQSKKNNI